jgi:hypothetical protein
MQLARRMAQPTAPAPGRLGRSSHQTSFTTSPHFTKFFLQMKIKMVWRNFFPQSSKSCDEVFHIVDTVFEGHRLASWYQ